MGCFSFSTAFIAVFLSVAAVSEGGSTHSHPFMKFTLPNRVYDILKLISLLATPLVTFIMSMSEIWGNFRYGTEIAATVAALGVLAGAILTKSSADYAKEKEREDEC